MKTTRREFLTQSAAAGISVPLIHPWLTASSVAATEDHILVVLQLRGGNDGTNTLAPAEHTIYQAARTGIALDPLTALPVGTSPVVGNVFLHPSMTAFKRLFDAGKLGIIQGVGYPNSSLSHFRSEDIIYSADPTIVGVRQGWLGTYFRDLYQGGFSIPALIAETAFNKSFAGYPGIPTISNPASFAVQTDPFRVGFDDTLSQTVIGQISAAARTPATPNPNLLFVQNGITRALADSVLLRTIGTAYTPRVTYPANNSLNSPLQLIARYITGGATTPGQGLDTKAYYLSTGGFDLHASQGGGTGAHATLLQRFSDALEAFILDLRAWGHSQRVVIMVWSEFSRRFGINGSLGTDHGRAGVWFVCGDPVIGGLYGAYPDINPITPPYDQKQTDPTTDFRNVFARLLNNWWGVDPTLVIPNWTPDYTNLAFI